MVSHVGNGGDPVEGSCVRVEWDPMLAWLSVARVEGLRIPSLGGGGGGSGGGW